MLVEVIDSWIRIETCNWNREGELNSHREDKESQLPQRLRNLCITYSDVERVEKHLEKMKSLWESSRGMKMLVEAIDSWMSIEACNWNKEGELGCHREDKESQLPKRLRNLSRTLSDTGCMVENDQRR